MRIEEVWQRLTGHTDIVSAARILAVKTRSLLSRGQGTPLSLAQLKDIGKSRGIRGYEFNAPLISEAQLLPLESGGFKVLVARGETTSRARFSVAHEIGHTFFYDQNSAPPKRLTSERSGDSAQKQQDQTRDTEELFCDAFASELLFPTDAAVIALRKCQDADQPLALISSLEKVSRSWCVSVLTALNRLNATQGISPSLSAVVLRWRPHPKTGRDPDLRVVGAFPRPSRGWFVPLNQRGSSIGLSGAVTLYQWWCNFPDRRPGGRYRRSGVFSLEAADGIPLVLENDASPQGEYVESLQIWCKAPENPKWHRRKVSVPVAYRLYAVNEMEAYCLAVMDASRAQDLLQILPKQMPKPDSLKKR